MKAYLLQRLQEPSTWRGLILLATALGMKVSPELAYAIASLGMALAGGLGVIAPDKIKAGVTKEEINRVYEHAKKDDLADLVKRNTEH